VKSWWRFVLGVIVGLLSAGGIWLASSPPRGKPVQLSAPPTLAPIQIHITGAVYKPGVYTLSVNARVQDAVVAAGGFTDDANPHSINLAAILQDGTQIWVPSVNPAEEIPEQQRYDNGGSNSIFSGVLININTATQEELETLPGIGPVIAKEIITYRQTQGDFKSIEELQKVSGIGPTIYEAIQNQITVGDLP